MGSLRRAQSEFDIYHVIERGAGKQLIFEDDEDREVYLSCLKGLVSTLPAEVYAWCLMGNHVHLVVHADLQTLSVFMRDLGRHYARHFNREHDRVGHLFQGRYRSIPVGDESQLLAVVRYVHRNPVEAGISDSCRYRWSSFREYLGEPGLSETSTVLGCFGSVAEFERFHEEGLPAAPPDSMTGRPVFRLSDDECLRIFRETLAGRGLASLPLDNREARNEVISELKRRGLSVRQVARLTGVGRGIVARVAAKKM